MKLEPDTHQPLDLTPSTSGGEHEKTSTGRELLRALILIVAAFAFLLACLHAAHLPLRFP